MLLLACVCTIVCMFVYSVRFLGPRSLHQQLRGLSFVFFVFFSVGRRRLQLVGGSGSAVTDAGVLAVLHAVEGDVDDGDQALGGAEGAEQPVGIGLAQDPQHVALVEAELSGLGGDVVTQRSDFTEEEETNSFTK